MAMSFGDAIMLATHGSKIARTGWNGKGMFLFFVPGGEMNHPLLPGTTKVLPYMMMYTAQGTAVPWLASQSDVLERDWITVD